MSKKLMATDKTVVTDFKVQIVDMHIRLKQFGGAKAAHIVNHSNIHQADYTVTKTERALMNFVKTLVIIESFGDVVLALSNGSGQITDVVCTGLFIFYGELDSVEVRAIDDTPVRISYIYS